MSLTLPRLRPRRRAATADTDASRISRALDRSQLLAELEVSVPAPERIVHWDAATVECATCTEMVARKARRCRSCGAELGVQRLSST